MKKLNELTKEQKLTLKQRLLDDETYDSEGRGASYGELASADRLVSDERLEEVFGTTEFSEDDFL